MCGGRGAEVKIDVGGGGYVARAAEQSLERVFSQHPSEELASFFPIITLP